MAPTWAAAAPGSFSGRVAAVARYDDEVQWAMDHGVDIAFNVYAGAGLELADQVAQVGPPDPGRSNPEDNSPEQNEPRRT